MSDPYNNLNVKKLLTNLVYLKLDQFFIDNNISSTLAKTIDTLSNEGSINIIIDLSDIDFLDSTYVSILLNKMKTLGIGGGSLRLVVMEDRPRLRFSINDTISELNLFLSKETAIQDYFD